MRLVSYNILDGGEGRADPLAEIILAQKPDIVALVEADRPEVVERIANRLGMESVEAAGKRHTVSLLSRWPIVESVNHGALEEDLANCFLEAVVHDDSGRHWNIGVVHLHPRARDEDDRRRQREIKRICEITSPLREKGEAHLLVGDFNSDSPIQQINPDACKPATRKAFAENGGHIPRAAIELLLRKGYVDTLAALHGADAGRMTSFTTHNPGQRLDYVFAFGFDAKIKKAWIEQDRLAQFASDHFPIGVEVD